MSKHSGNAPVKQDVRVFQSTIDTSSIVSTVFNQPSFYMGIVNMVIMYLTQRFPEELMSPKYLTMTYNGIRAPAMLTIPFCCIAGGYFSVASVISTSAFPLAGHLCGYTLSLGVGLTMLTFRRVSWYYPLLGVMYLSFGGFHHYRRMMVYGDNAPIYNWGDMSEIWNARAEAKREARQQRLLEKEAMSSQK
ncbi:uncharacterized protein TM35_000121190 [Trypanosoma theileri]|uniref:Transmembrane protein n=1 Tax=Trypanosoma theileri TaxID=67003 RepID=A0A1X0NXC0_9TRYP|nr:uncharacterized protein TM35_000121190 [Trypanosoma theileri]ORC89344.1 hypothetical protein TM35_000121190 [Trypanosoma theileri]